MLASVCGILLLLGPRFLTANAAEAVPAAEWSLIPDLRIGAADDPDQALSRVSDVALGPDGIIAVGQPTESGVRLFDARGRLLRPVGRRGDGPGEFRRVARLAWQGGLLHVVDPTLQRITSFHVDGSVAATARFEPPPVAPPLAPPRPLGRFHDGSALGGGAVFPFGADEIRAAVPLARIFADGRVSPLGTVSQLGMSVSYRFGAASMLAPRPVPFHDLTRVAANGRSFVVVRRAPRQGRGPATFAVERLRPDGSVAFSRRYSYRPTPIARRTADSIIHAEVERFGRKRLPAGIGLDEDEVRRALALPTHQPPVTALMLGRDGTIWLRREVLGENRTTWLVLDPDGSPLATVRAPAGLELHAADGSHAVGVVHDELDVPFVVRYRIVRLRDGAA